MQLKNQEDETESKIDIDLFSRGIVTKPRSKRRTKWRMKRRTKWLTKPRTKRRTNAETKSTSLPKIENDVFNRDIETKPRTKAKTEEKMVTISMYRGNMHKVSDVPRQWPMPEHTLSIKDFKSLLHRRKQALSRISLNSNPSGKNELVTDQEEDVIPPERPGSPGEKNPVEEKRDGFEGTGVGRSDDVEHSGRVEVILKKEADDIPHEVKETFEVEKRCKEIEERLQVLKTKKHNLVQILKQILNAEEEFKRRSNVVQQRQGFQE